MPASKSAAVAGGESEAALSPSPTISELIAAFRTPPLPPYPGQVGPAGVMVE